MVRNMIRFYGEDLLAARPTTKLEDHTLSDIRYSLFNIFQATLHTGGHSSIRNLRTRQAVMTGTHLPRLEIFTISKNFERLLQPTNLPIQGVFCTLSRRFRKTAESDNQRRHISVSLYLSISSYGTTKLPLDGFS